MGIEAIGVALVGAITEVVVVIEEGEAEVMPEEEEETEARE